MKSEKQKTLAEAAKKLGEAFKEFERTIGGNKRNAFEKILFRLNKWLNREISDFWLAVGMTLVFILILYLYGNSHRI